MLEETAYPTKKKTSDTKRTQLKILETLTRSQQSSHSLYQSTIDMIFNLSSAGFNLLQAVKEREDRDKTYYLSWY